MSGRLSHKVAIVTGSGGEGMGRAAALLFAREGATVIGCDVNVEGSLETARMVRADGGRMETLEPLDLSNEEAARKLVAFAVEKAGGIDILYNNVAITRPGYSLTQSPADMEHTILGCIMPGWLMARHAAPEMQKRGGGSIINIASITAIAGGTGLAGNANFLFSYGVAKAGVIRMTELLAIDLAKAGVRVNCITPGSILPVTRKFAGEDGTALNAKWLDAMLIKRLGRAEDIANAALFFAGEESSYITGQNLVVDGGVTVSGWTGGPVAEMLETMTARSNGVLPEIPPLYRK